MAKKLGTKSSDGEGLTAEITTDKDSTPTFAFEGFIDDTSLDSCSCDGRRMECESFLQVLHALFESLETAQNCNGKADKSCTLTLKICLNGQVAQLETPMKLSPGTVRVEEVAKRHREKQFHQEKP